MSEGSDVSMEGCAGVHEKAVVQVAATSPLEQVRQATSPWRVAIVHDWLVTNGGAEKVLEALLRAFPQADIFTLVDTLPDRQRGWLKGHKITTSFLQRLPLAKKRYRHFLPLMPLAVEQFDVSDYDLVISSSHAVAKGVITHPQQTHICYCHTPIRYAWDMKESYLADAGFPAPLSWLARYVLHRLRQWDYFSATQVDYFWANSRHVATRIDKYYARSSQVLYPPVAVDQLPCHEGERENFYLAASRLVPYKRLDLIVEAFLDMPERRLVIIGDGPERTRLTRLAKDADNIELLGYCEDDVLRDHLSRARGFVFAANEDFGILPLEAQACGTPVIAFGQGGARETVRPASHPNDENATGVFFEKPITQSLHEAILGFELRQFSPQACRRNAERFSEEAFWRRLHSLLQAAGLLETAELPREPS
nr:glycosyltransferase family 4 protein [uncultured Halomonas sp.]